MLWNSCGDDFADVLVALEFDSTDTCQDPKISTNGRSESCTTRVGVWRPTPSRQISVALLSRPKNDVAISFV